MFLNNPTVELRVRSDGSFQVHIHYKTYTAIIDRDGDGISWMGPEPNSYSKDPIEMAATWLVGLLPRVSKPDP